MYAMGTNLELKRRRSRPVVSLRKTKRDNTSTADVPEYFSPPNNIAPVMDLTPPTVLFRDDYLRAFSKMFASSRLDNFNHNPAATFPIFFSRVRVPQETPANGFILAIQELVHDLDLCVPLADKYQSAYGLCSFYAYVQGFRLFTRSKLIFFSDKGPVEFRSDWTPTCEGSTAWALFDSTPSFKEPPDTFLTKKFSIVQTPSPCSDRSAWLSNFPQSTSVV